MDENQAWLENLYCLYWGKLVKLASYLLFDKNLAEDITQTVFFILCMKQTQLKDHPNIEGWLTWTMRNLIMNENRKTFRSLEVPLDTRTDLDAAQGHTKISPDFFDILPSGLSQSEQELLYLIIDVGLTHKEIAQLLGCSEAASRMRLSRAKARCKELLLKEKKLF